jgi:signal transduction histidine kinase
MRRILGSLLVRIGLALLLGFVALQAVVVAATLWNDGRPVVFRLISPRQAAAIADALEAASPSQQAKLLTALNGGSLAVHLQPAFADDGPHRVGGNAPYLEKLYGEYAAELGGRPFQVQAREGSALASLSHDRLGAPVAVRLLVRLDSGGVVVIEREPVLLHRLMARFAFVGSAIGAILLLILLFCMQQMVVPAHRLARAAKRLAADIDMADLPTHGASEMKMLAVAFNDMKRTIRELLQERTHMLAAIAHDLRTYLTRLRLRANFIRDPDQQERAIRDLEEMGLLLDDTLLFARQVTTVPADQQRVVDANEEILAFVTMRRELGDRVDWNTSCLAPLPIRCSPLALQRMLANLTDNALRYGAAAHISTAQRSDAVEIAIEDEGPGVPPEAVARLVRPFERLEPSRNRRTGGAGLGLAIVTALAEGQGGTLALENVAQGGLRAVLLLRSARTEREAH